MVPCGGDDTCQWFYLAHSYFSGAAAGSTESFSSLNQFHSSSVQIMQSCSASVEFESNKYISTLPIFLISFLSLMSGVLYCPQQSDLSAITGTFTLNNLDADICNVDGNRLKSLMQGG